MPRLSCMRCKERKVRCNRTVPRCNHCTVHNANCVYPERAKRLPQQRPSAPPEASTGEGAGIASPAEDSRIGNVLARIQRLEQQNSQQARHSRSIGTVSASLNSSLSSPPVTTPAFSDGTTPLSSTAPPSKLDVTATLCEAIEQVKRHMQRQNARDIITGHVYVPADLARTWMNYYLDTMSTDIFPSLINQRVLRMIPDIINEPHIHIDLSMQVLYYVICFHGYMMSPVATKQERAYASSCYVGCLRAIPQWKKEAKGSATDFAAALLLTRIATAMFDYDVAWDMHKLTNDIARARNLQNIDGGADPNLDNTEESNDDRRGFWYLIQIDLYIRLLMDKPPTITADKWQVNLPWLHSSAQDQPPEGIQAIGFLISSRITMVLMRFFTLLDNPSRSSKGKMVSETEELCHEIEHIFTDWKVLELFSETSDSSDALWVVVDCLITGYTSIIFMLRKVEVIFTGQAHTMTEDSHLPSHPLALEASRHIVRVCVRLLNCYAVPDMVSSTFGAYQVYAAISRIYLEAIHERGSNAVSHKEDLRLLETFSRQIVSICNGHEDMFPFIRAINTLNELIKDKAV